MVVETILGAIQSGTEPKFWIDTHVIADVGVFAAFRELDSVFDGEEWTSSLQNDFLRGREVSDDIGHWVSEPTST